LNTYNNIAKLYLDTGLGFNEKQSMSQIISGSKRDFVFDLREYSSIEKLRFDPINDYSVLYIHSIRIFENEDFSFELQSYKSNAFQQKGNSFIFATNDPHIYIDVSKITIQKIIFTLEYVAIGKESFQYLLQCKDELIAEKSRQIKEKERLIKRKEQQIQYKKEEIYQLDRRYKGQLAIERASREAIVNSKLWRLMIPIRRIFVHVRKFTIKIKTIACSFSRQHRLIKKSGLFDTTYYVEQNKDVKESNINPLAHYILSGASEGREPNPLFNSQYYLDENPDIAESGINPLAHYITVGFKEGRNPHPLFNTLYYLKENSDVTESGMNPLVHFIEKGFKEGRNPHPLFNISYYVYQNPDVTESGMNPLLHYFIFGARERRNPSPFFDTSYYLDMNPDLVESNMNPLAHFIKFGVSDKRDPNPLFDVSYYLSENQDVAESGMNPLIHYVEGGAREGRSPVPHGIPKISIICPVYNVNEVFLHKCVFSLLYQSYYYNWELCLVDDGSSKL